MKNSEILLCVCRILFPFILLFGVYIIINGHLSPGGGFQGGAILATAILISYFIYPDIIGDLQGLIKLEKYIFLILLVFASLSFVTRGEFFTSFLPSDSHLKFRPIFLTTFNILIGLKVSTGLILIFSTFIKEGV